MNYEKILIPENPISYIMTMRENLTSFFEYALNTAIIFLLLHLFNWLLPFIVIGCSLLLIGIVRWTVQFLNIPLASFWFSNTLKLDNDGFWRYQDHRIYEYDTVKCVHLIVAFFGFRMLIRFIFTLIAKKPQ